MSDAIAQQLIGVASVPIIAALVEALYSAFARLPKSARVLVSLTVGISWIVFVSISIGADLRTAPLTGILLGLASANPRAVMFWQDRERNNTP